MKNNKMATLAAVAAAMMMTVTACGSSSNAETTTAVPETTTQAVTTTQAPETTTMEESSEEDTSESETEETPNVGSVTTDGVFESSNGKYSIKIPDGWNIDAASDESITSFMSANGENYIEVVSESGDISGLVEELPATADEYKKMIAKDDNFDIQDYKVTKDGGKQVFSYSIQYKDADAPVSLFITSGYYDTDKGEYVSAVAEVISKDAAVTDEVKAAMSSFSIKALK